MHFYMYKLLRSDWLKIVNNWNIENSFFLETKAAEKSNFIISVSSVLKNFFYLRILHRDNSYLLKLQKIVFASIWKNKT